MSEMDEKYNEIEICEEQENILKIKHIQRNEIRTEHI